MGHPWRRQAAPMFANRRYPPTSPVTAPPVRVSVIRSCEVTHRATRAAEADRDGDGAAGEPEGPPGDTDDSVAVPAPDPQAAALTTAATVTATAKVDDRTRMAIP